MSQTSSAVSTIIITSKHATSRTNTGSFAAHTNALINTGSNAAHTTALRRINTS
jgi:hypothetical protein